MKKKICPVCGGEIGIFYNRKTLYFISCKNKVCGARTKVYDDEQLAISAWNQGKVKRRKPRFDFLEKK